MQLNNKVIIAAAGAGKTWGICKEVIKEAKNTTKKILIITYTNKGVESIETEYKKQNFGVIDENVVILTWFQFLLSELVKPYQRAITNEYNAIKSIDFNHQYGFINYAKRGTKKHYITSNNDILSNTVSEFVIDNNEKTDGKVIARLEEIYSRIYIDEIQDLVGEDLELLKLLFNSKIYEEDYNEKVEKYNRKLEILENKIEQLKLLAEDKKSISDGLKKVRELLDSKDIMNEFDQEIFNAIVDYVIVGGYDESGIIDPYLIGFILKREFDLSAPKDVPDEVIIRNNKIDLNSNNVLVDFINTRKYFSYENGKLNKVLRNGLRIRVEYDIT